MTCRETVLFVSAVVMALLLLLGLCGGWFWLRQERLTQVQNIDRSQFIQELQAMDRRLKVIESR